MRLAVLSDIHGNLAALEAVLADIQSVGEIDLIWCLGDIAAFGPRPAEVIRRIKSLAEADEGKKFKVIGGNTDRYLVTCERPNWPPPADADAYKKRLGELQNFNAGLLWCLEHIAFEDYEYLSKVVGHELARYIDGYGTVIGYHAVPGDDEATLNSETPLEQARDYLLDREGRLALGGHLHRQFQLDLGAWRAVNVGSVGMSADAPGFAQWTLLAFDNGEVSIDFRRIPYDVDALIADFYAVGYPGTGWTARYLRQES